MREPGGDRARWQRIKQLVADAAARPPAERAQFLAGECPDDAAMREEIAALVASQEQANDFLERHPAVGSVLADIGYHSPERPPHLTAGTRIGPYEIAAPIGAGGMGEVYRARDTRLHRSVAVKILPEMFRVDPDRLARFTREAQVLASLNHPHIAAIYGFEESLGVQALVLELVEGPTLADRIKAGAIPLDEALPIARQIAEALEAAHEQGIVHRDLKPANIKLRPDGMVKVLDFGLAKALEPTGSTNVTVSPTITAPAMTGTGVLLGTAAYMSPEQTRGQPVDRRADVWAFGCVLFEMLTGRRPFDGETVTDVLAAVTRDTPRFDALPASTPTRVRLLLARCLERDPKRRLRDMGDARLELETPDIAAAMPAPGESPAPTSRARLRRGAFLAAALMLLGVTAGLAWWTGRTQTTGPAAEAPFLRLTSDAGLTTDPALSPDGRLVVYASDRAGDDNLDLWVQQIDGGTPLRLTFDPGDEYEPSFSPDGTRIVFRSDRDGGGVYVMPALGGESRLIAKAGRQPRFSPDGRRIAYVTTVASSQGQGGITDANLFVVPSGGGAAQMLVSEKVGASSPVWSPDGAFILFAKGVNRIEDWSIVRSDRAEDAPTVLALAPLQKAGLADIAPREWVAGNRILFEAKLGDSSHIFKIGLSPPSWITKKWRLDPSPRRLTAGTEQDEQPALASLVSAPGGRRLAFASLLRKENVWSVLLDANRPRTVGKLSQLTQASGFQLFPAISMDGTKLAFISHAAYNDEVWLLDVRTGKRSLLSTAVSLKYRTHIRRDGLEVFYGDTGTTLPSSVPESDAVYTVSVSGGAPERLCEQCSAYVWDWSPDRRWLLTWSLGKSSVTAKLMDLETKKSRLLPERPGADLYDFEWSPNGRWVVFMAQAAGRTRVYVAPFDGDAGPAENTWIPITNGSTAEHHIHWSPDGGWIYAISNRDGFSCVWAYPVDPETMQPRGEPVAVFHAHGARRSLGNANLVSQSLSVARDKIVFSQGEITGNIWMTALNDRD